MTNFMFDLKHTIRSLVGSPGLFANAVLLLALGIGATTAIFSVVNRVLLDPLPYQDPEELVMLWSELTARDVTHFPESPPNLDDYNEQSNLFEHVAGVFTLGQAFVRNGAEPRQLTQAVVTWNFLTMLGIRPTLGRAFDANDGAFNESEVPPDTDFPANVFLPPRTALISHSLWQREFASDPAAIGEFVELGGNPVEIVGVLPPGFRLHMPPAAGIAPDVDIWTPTRVDLAAAPRNNMFLQVAGRLKDGVAIAQAQQEIDVITDRIIREMPSLGTAGLRKVVRPYGGELTADVNGTIWALMGAAIFVLLIACANVANLLLVRAAGRMRQFSVRAALGASRWRLIRHMLLEAGVLVVCGAFCGVLVALAGLKAILVSAPASIPRLELAGFDMNVLLFSIAVAAGTTLLAGLAPALRGTRVQSADQLKERSSSSPSPGGRRLLNGLVVGEIAMSFVLLIATLLMIRSFVELHRVDPGFKPESLLTFELNLPFGRYPDEGSRNGFVREFRERLAGLPGVTSVSGVTPLPLSGEPFNGRYTTNNSPDENAEFGQAQYRLVLPDYFESMQTPLLSGRYLNRDDDVDARRYVVVDETLAEKSWPAGDAIGKHLWVRLAQEVEAWEVVGVVRRQAENSLQETPRPTIYFPNGAGGPFGGINDWVVRSVVDPLSIVPQVKRELAAMDANLPLAKVRPMTDYISESMARTRFATQLISAFGVAALAIAMIGLYAVLYHAVQQRCAEVGVRMSFGARGADIFQLFLRHGLLLSLLGVSIGIVTAVAVSRSIASLLVGVSAQDPLTYFAAVLLFVMIAVAATLVPAWQASRIDPMRVLREA